MPIKVFVSSRSEGMKDFRAAVNRAVTSLGDMDLHFVARLFEDFPAQADTPHETCRDWIDASDIYLGIFGPEISRPVEDEYAYARAQRKICLLFWLEEPDGGLPEYLKDRNRWDEGHFVKGVANSEELTHEVFRALQRVESRFYHRYLRNLKKVFQPLDDAVIGTRPLGMDEAIAPRFRIVRADPHPHTSDGREKKAFLDLDDLLRDGRSWLIQGPSGSGKSTALHKLTHDLAGRHLESPEEEGSGGGETASRPLLPIYIRLKTEGASLTGNIKESVRRYGFPENDDPLEPRGKQEPLLLLDGFDEITAPRAQADCLREVNELVQGRDIRCVMTSRPLAALQEKFAGILEMDLLRDDELVGVFSLYLDEARSRELLGKLRKLGIHTAIRRPLVAKFVALAFGNLDTEETEFSRGSVYRRVFRDNLLKVWDAKGLLEPDLERYRGVVAFLGRLGYEMVERNAVFLDEQEGEQLLPDLRTPEGGRFTLPKLVASLAGHGILEPGPGRLEFAHLSFRDFFAAHHLVETANPRTWRKKALSVCWRESLYFLLGLVSEKQARDFLVWLIEHRKTRWTLKAARYLHQDMSFVYFVFRCLVENPHAVDDLKDRFIQPYDGWTPFINSGGCDWELFIGKGPSEDYGRLFGWIGMMGTPRAVEILKAKPSNLQAEAVFGLVHVGDLDLVLDLLRNVRTFGSGPLTGREYILLALFSNPDPRVKFALNAILTGEDAEARHRFLSNLMFYTSQEGERNPGFLVKFDPELVRNMVQVALTAETQEERRAPIACLLNSEGIPRKLPELVEDQLVKAMESEDQKIRSIALGHLHNTGSDRAKKALRTTIGEEGRGLQEQLSALVSLHHHYYMKWADDYPEAFLQFLRDNLPLVCLDDAQGAADTAEAFNQLPEVVEMDPERAKDLTLLVTGARFCPISFLRGYCLEMLAIRDGTVATPYMVDAFEQDEDLGVRYEALRNLWNLTGEKAVPQIRQALQDPDGKMRLHATSLCGFMSPEVHAKIEDLLWDLIEDEEDMARVYARKALGAINPYSNAPAIIPEPKDDRSRE